MLGAAGEALAVQWLQEKKFNLLHLNWRHSRYEVDIIAADRDILHFIEVKTRQNKTFGKPEESVDIKKIENLMKAAEEFQYQYPQWKRVQYDVLSITVNPDGAIEYFFIEDVYL
jgi:putative endonuclease